jgi:hypothetical protein
MPDKMEMHGDSPIKVLKVLSWIVKSARLEIEHDCVWLKIQDLLEINKAQKKKRRISN